MLSLLQRPAPAVQSASGCFGPGPAFAARRAAGQPARSGCWHHRFEPAGPIHIHIAEQTQEVEDCIAWSGQRPWCNGCSTMRRGCPLVPGARHPHGACRIRRAAARTGAVAGICPSTEANLGDGIFDMPQWLAHGGAWGVGSDSHACVNAAEELLLLEYGQRLSLRQRNVLASNAHAQVATAMTQQAVQGGAQAAGRNVARLAVGQQADMLALDAQHVALAGWMPSVCSPPMFVCQPAHECAAQPVVGGVPRVVGGRHALRGEAARAFVAARQATIAAD